MRSFSPIIISLVAALIGTRNSLSVDGSITNSTSTLASRLNGYYDSLHSHDIDGKVSSSYQTTTKTAAPRVLVIGFGPSGMFFCHALETRRRELEQLGDMEGLSRLPRVTVIERASTHGGVWRQWGKDFITEQKQKYEESQSISSSTTLNDDDAEVKKNKPMYEGMWVNGAKELAEFGDYTFDDHFGCALPPYIQRGAILEYIEARVTNDCPDFFNRYVTYNTEVDNVKYDDSTEVFTATSTNLLTLEENTAQYDKVIWAAGVNTIPFTPQDTADILAENFTGTMMHSSEVNKFQHNIEGKRVLLIGGASSAEDMALTAIKLGVEKVYISHRNKENSVVAHAQWPLDKVQLVRGMIPVGLEHNETHYNCVDFEYVDPVTYEHMNEDNWQDFYEDLDSFDDVEICNFDTIIFCTGYKPDFSMLDPSVSGVDYLKEVNIYEGPRLVMPDGWTMPPNTISDIMDHVGHIEPSRNLRYWNRHPYLYRHSVSIDNPNMMYMIPNAISLDQLLWADVLAHQVLGFITGDIPMPKKDVMLQRLFGRIHHEMSIPTRRYLLDPNYKRAVFDEVEDELIPADISRANEIRESQYHFRALAELINESRYPMDIGTFEELNEKGNTFVNFDMHDRNNRKTKDSSLKTFRDLENSELRFLHSVHTGTQAVKFKQMWMEIDDFSDVRDQCMPIINATRPVASLYNVSDSSSSTETTTSSSSLVNEITKDDLSHAIPTDFSSS